MTSGGCWSRELLGRLGSPSEDDLSTVAWLEDYWRWPSAVSCDVTHQHVTNLQLIQIFAKLEDESI
jgi:hypothetical protein